MGVEELGARFSATFQEFAECTPLVWGPLGSALVEAVAPVSGDRVLDVCCGAGASAIPAAIAAGPTGSVDAVDLAGGLLALGEKFAGQQGVTNIGFAEADVTAWQLPDGTDAYDVVQSSFGIFFLPDMDDSVRRLVGMLRPGGKFGATVWRAGVFEDYGKALFDVAERYRPDVRRNGDGPPEPITRINRAESLRTWLDEIGLTAPTVRTVARSVPLTQEFAWAFVLGSGFRRVVEGLAPEQVRALRADFLAQLDERGVRELDLTTLVGVGHRPE
ncbi:class I SAM-dependent methyltransferase [Saccharopolyspora indica]|uniref:class I SAM-dependent methyltransferase n=1 Tax=Saccharopolyspora indica TaxID=1229659 RepID=UPI0022EB8C6D|nr:class I SAM-dependent methyltransferase [Saccharopolyspora indica]MDA3647509.1 class I SAM-dependent methyltransferase [Saccharopolyspora indica]